MTIGRAERRREKILRSAYLLLVRGKSIPTMREIALKSDMGLGTVYYYFRSLDQIFIELETLFYRQMVGYLKDVILSDISSDKATCDESLLLFMAAETYRSLTLFSQDSYVDLFRSLPISAIFSDSRRLCLEKLLDPLWERSDDYDIYHYLGLYMAFFAKVDSEARIDLIYDGMERLFFSFLQDNLDLWDLSETFCRVKELDKVISLENLFLPWNDAEKE